MYQGNNPVALRSIDMITDAMLELLKERNIDEISIKELCTKADISRPTFYQMFNSKEEIVQYRMEQFFELYRQQIFKKNVAPNDLSNIVHIFFEIVGSNPEFREVSAHNNFSNYLSEAFIGFLKQIDELHFPQLSNEENDYLFAFISGAVTQVIRLWFNTNFKMPAL